MLSYILLDMTNNGAGSGMSLGARLRVLTGKALCALSVMLAIGASMVSGVWIAVWVLRQDLALIWTINWILGGWGLATGIFFMLAAPVYLLGTRIAQAAKRPR